MFGYAPDFAFVGRNYFLHEVFAHFANVPNQVIEMEFLPVLAPEKTRCSSMEIRFMMAMLKSWSEDDLSGFNFLELSIFRRTLNTVDFFHIRLLLMQ